MDIPSVSPPAYLIDDIAVLSNANDATAAGIVMCALSRADTIFSIDDTPASNPEIPNLTAPDDARDVTNLSQLFFSLASLPSILSRYLSFLVFIYNRYL